MSENILDADDDAVCKTETKKDITLRKEVFKPVWREGIPGRRSSRQGSDS